MPLTTKTFSELVTLAKNAVRTRITQADTSDGSHYDLFSRMLAAVFFGNQEQARYVLRQIFPDTAETSFLEDHADGRGIDRLQPAAGGGQVQIEGTASSTQGAGSALTHADGTAYTMGSGVTLTLPTWTGKTVGSGSSVGRVIVLPDVSDMSADDLVTIDGEVRAIRTVLNSVNAIDFYEPLAAAPAATTAITATAGAVATVTADATGKSANKDTGDTLTLSSPGAGVTAATTVLEISGGRDLERDEELAERIQDFDSRRPGAGNLEQIREWARTVDGVGVSEAFVFPGFRGFGTVDVVIYGASGSRAMPSEDVATVQAALDTLTDPGLDLLVLSAVFESIPSDIVIRVEPAPGFEADFSDLTFEITGSSSTTSRLFLNADPVGTIEVGDRVFVPVQIGGMWKTYEQNVTALNSGSQYIDVEAPSGGVALPAAPTVGTEILPSGPFGATLLAAIEAVFEDLGPGTDFIDLSIQSAITVHRHPEPATAFDPNLRETRLLKAALGVTGAEDANVSALKGTTSPIEDVIPDPQETVMLGKLLVEIADI